uniref:Uncharacterized protein n=1 Tax=Oryza nivara TaxID=4536 RepID=A0A0E0IFE6_ORYNI
MKKLEPSSSFSLGSWWPIVEENTEEQDLQLELAGGDGDGRNLWLWPAIAKREDGRNEEGGRLVLVTPSPLPARSFTVSKIFYSFAATSYQSITNLQVKNRQITWQLFHFVKY